MWMAGKKGDSRAGQNCVMGISYGGRQEYCSRLQGPLWFYRAKLHVLLTADD